MKQFFTNMNYWQVAFWRVLLYMTVVGAGDFLTDTETWSQDTWNATGLFLKVRLFLSNWVAMAGVLLAFLDSTMSELRGKKNGNGVGHTETFIPKP